MLSVVQPNHGDDDIDRDDDDDDTVTTNEQHPRPMRLIIHVITIQQPLRNERLCEWWIQIKMVICKIIYFWTKMNNWYSNDLQFSND
jgi:hypothetical protein